MPSRSSYHHGDLLNALVEAGTALARAGGPDAVVVREAARRAGVSHAAAYRHFDDRSSLLVAVAAGALGHLARAIERAQDGVDDPRERLRAVGRAYVGFALDEPGLFRLAFSHHPPEGPARAPARGASGLDPAELMSRTLDGLVDAGLLRAERLEQARLTAWSAVHGLAGLLLDGPLSTLPDAAKRQAVEAVVVGVERGVLDP